MRGELASHNITLDLDPVEEKVALLREAPEADVRILLDQEPGGKFRVA